MAPAKSTTLTTLGKAAWALGPLVLRGRAARIQRTAAHWLPWMNSRVGWLSNRLPLVANSNAHPRGRRPYHHGHKPQQPPEGIGALGASRQQAASACRNLMALSIGASRIYAGISSGTHRAAHNTVALPSFTLQAFPIALRPAPRQIAHGIPLALAQRRAPGGRYQLTFECGRLSATSGSPRRKMASWRWFT